MRVDSVHHPLRRTRAAIVVGLVVWAVGAWWAVRVFGGLPGLLAIGWGVSFALWIGVCHGRTIRGLLAGRNSAGDPDVNPYEPAA